MKFLVDAQLPPGLCRWLEVRAHERQHFAGTRVLVAAILDALAEGVGEGELHADFPYVTREDIRVRLAFATSTTDETTALDPLAVSSSCSSVDPAIS